MCKLRWTYLGWWKYKGFNTDNPQSINKYPVKSQWFTTIQGLNRYTYYKFSVWDKIELISAIA